MSCGCRRHPKDIRESETKAMRRVALGALSTSCALCVDLDELLRGREERGAVLDHAGDVRVVHGRTNEWAPVRLRCGFQARVVCA